jgi:thiamine biosynthesis lipoprotein
MGTYYRIQVAGEEMSEDRRRTLHEAAVAEMDAVDASMSTYLEDSEVSRFNRHPDPTPFAVSAETFEVLRTALEISARTGGAFDVTVEPLVETWGFGPGAEPPRQLEDEEIEALLGRIGYDKLTLDEAASTVAKSLGGIHCDLSGIAKGHAVDRVAERLASLGVADFWVEIGGEVRAAGSNAGGTAWRLGIERPLFLPGTVQRIVPLDDMAVATSGDYRNYREVDGDRYSHLIDPRSGRPIGHHLASVSVFHRRCAIADAWATALMVMGEEEGFEAAAEEGLAALFLVREGDEVVELATPEFRELPSPRPSPATGEGATTRPGSKTSHSVRRGARGLGDK